MTDFLAKNPSLDSNWRAVVLFGRNVASYKLALAKTLLGVASRADDRVPLEELAARLPSKSVSTWPRLTNKRHRDQVSSWTPAVRSTRGSCRDKLVQTTVKLGFNNVINAFHIVGSGPVPLRFFVDERTTGGSPAIRLTDDLQRLTGSFQGDAPSAEAESRWRLVETAWQLDLPRAGVAVHADLTHNLLFVERRRRVNLTSVRPALNGYQKGRCFDCGVSVSLALVDVDHFFPWILKDRGEMPDADGVWNLVLACQRCNRGEGGKFFAVPSARLIEKLHQRNNWLVESHHPLRETIMLQTGQTTEARASFLRSRPRVALDHLIHQWAPAEVATDD
jgi:5-methylcytosine-specific restriction endonuclease McrA